MPIYYKFTDEAENDVPLDQIDRLVRIDFGKEPSNHRYSFEFMAITDIGDFGLQRWNIERSHICSIIERNPKP